MPDEHEHAWSAASSQRDEPAMVHLLQEAVVTRYPVPDATTAWNRVLALQTTPGVDGGASPIDPQRFPRFAVARTSAVQHRDPASTQAPSTLPALVSWRAILGVVTLATVIVVGLLGSLRGSVAWPPLPAQTSEPSVTMPAVSSAAQDVLAFDPALLVRHLGAGWSLSSGRALVAEVGAPDFTGFLGTTRLVLRGPEEALITVEVRPVAADFFSMDSAWSWAHSDALMEQGRLVAAEASSESANVQGCRQALHIERMREADRTAIGGVTLCAVASSEIVLVTTSGAVLGAEGWAASDQVASVVAQALADATFVPTHRYEGASTPARGLLQSPLTNAPVTQPLTWGTLLRWTGDAAVSPIPDSETPWLKMRTAEGMEGWVSGDLLAPAVEGEVLGTFPIPTPTQE